MALIDCRECDKRISESALGCPHCGFMLTRDVVAAQKEAQLKREQEAAGEAKREERRMAIWFGGIVATIILAFVFCVAVPSPQYEPRWSDGVSDTSSAKQAPWLRGFSDSEKETVLQESYLFDAAAKELERERD